MELHIRATELSDLAALNALTFRSKASNGYDTAFMEACRGGLILTADRLVSWIARLAETNVGQLVGHYGICRELGAVKAKMFFVEPGLKRTGIGRAMWKHLLRDAETLNGQAIRIVSDPAAVPFYLAMGAREIGTMPSGAIKDRQLPLLEAPLPARSMNELGQRTLAHS